MAPQMDVNIIRRPFKLICRASAGAHVKTLGPVQDARTSTSADMHDKESQLESRDAVPKAQENIEYYVVERYHENNFIIKLAKDVHS